MKINVRIERIVQVEVPVGWTIQRREDQEMLFRRLEEQYPELVPVVAEDEGQDGDWRVVIDWPTAVQAPPATAPGGAA